MTKAKTTKPLSSLKTTKREPIAVAISDPHLSLKFFDQAVSSLAAATDHANTLGVPLLVSGDIHDTKANLRSECIRALRQILSEARVRPILLVGNHDRENEKSPHHALSAFEDLADIINVPLEFKGIHFIPYCHDKDAFLAALENVPNDAQLIVHQGLAGARMGEYIADRSQVDPTVFDRFTKPVYSGHYHEKQTIGNFTYFGTPFTTSFSEAGDGPKGYHVLYSDGTIEMVELLGLSKHVIIETTAAELGKVEPQRPHDKIWVKVSGPASELSKINKAALGEKLLGHGNFKLDREPTEAKKEAKKTEKKRSYSDLLLGEIKASSEPARTKTLIEATWKELEQCES